MNDRNGKASILVVDDEEIVQIALKDWLTNDGYAVHTVGSGAAALDTLEDGNWELVLLDLKMPAMDGIETLKRIRAVDESMPVIIMTAYATVDTAVAAMKEGAYDYLVKPFNPEEMLLSIKKIIEHRRLVEENIILRRSLTRQYQFGDIIAKSHRMQEIFELIKTVAPSSATILIQGESGTGKELVARAVHGNSPRSEKPFIALNCAALPETLLESELFGYEKGAFTGAAQEKKGRFEIADGGTLFLDEVSEMNLKTQVELLRVLEEKEVTRIGGVRTVPVDVRIVAATNENLRDAVEKKKFREDLFYRLHVVCIELPPLRERKEDVPMLAENFLKKFSVQNRKDVRYISLEAFDCMMRYPWPGNVRELENTIERAVLLSRSRAITPEYLPEYVRKFGPEHEPGSPSETDSLRDAERNYILDTLKQTDWNVKRTAELLKVHRSTLYNKMKRYGLRRDEGA
ncbi:MAG: sigma-54 dependent transcriptional regulator [bacterium]